MSARSPGGSGEAAPASLRSDPWTGPFVGKTAYQLELRSELQAGTLKSTLSDLTAPAFVTAKIDAQRVADLARLEEAGFRLITAELGFSGSALSSNDSDGVRFAVAEDEMAVADLARRSFSYSRFHVDPEIGGPAANELKAAWARNYFAGERGDWMVVAEQGGELAGFLQLMRSDDALVIDLVAVGGEHRGQGLARRMVGYAVTHCGAGSFVRVGTQLTNLASIRLYQSLGLSLDRAQYVFHLHVV